MGVPRRGPYHLETHYAAADALDSGHLGGAAFDVYPEEPEGNDQEFVSRLRQFENVILTPHVAGASPRIAERHLAVLLDNVGRFARGEPLANLVDKQRWF